jgi:hypothetical protein
MLCHEGSHGDVRPYRMSYRERAFCKFCWERLMAVGCLAVVDECSACEYEAELW